MSRHQDQAHLRMPRQQAPVRVQDDFFLAGVRAAGDPNRRVAEAWVVNAEAVGRQLRVELDAADRGCCSSA